MKNILRVGTRPSRLAVRQAAEISAYLPDVRFKVVTIDTKGDLDKTTPLSQLEGTDFFTSEIEHALIAGWIDAGIHSAKDLEDEPPEELTIAAITRSISGRDCLVSKNGLLLQDLPKGAVVGTSSLKRKEAVSKFRPDLVIRGIRGDIDERLLQLDNGRFDAIIVAHAALIRLGYQDRISEILPENIVRAHPLQGKLAVQVRKNRTDLLNIFERIDERHKG